MFQNLSLKGFTWKREPILYITLLVAILNVVITAMSGDLAWGQAGESIILLLFGFFGRGQVTPV